MKRLIKNNINKLKRQAGIDCNDLISTLETNKNNLIRVFGDITNAMNSFENDNKLTFDEKDFPTNNSNNPFNSNCDIGHNFSNISNYLTMYFNELKQNISQEMGEINEDSDGDGVADNNDID